MALQVLKEVARRLTKSIDRAVEGKDQIVAPLKTCRLVDKDVVIRTKFSMNNHSCDVCLSATETQLGRRTIIVQTVLH